ncbi:ATP-binding cassette domain-containing protein [Pseudomonas fulva]|uniref:ATP-binding cassette domain-containing protein n=1 Tax=Pseudomonas fulva TaxID=47880 RepID=UPI003461B83B
MCLLTLTELSFSYKKSLLFHKINIHLASGEAVGILGCNGAGKTTLFDIISGLRRPTGGVICNHAYHPAYLTQVLTPPPQLRMGEVYELITLLNMPALLSIDQAIVRLDGWSPVLGRRFSEIAQKKASKCSYGEVRSFISLTLLLTGSDLIMLDEPTAGVDPEFRHYIWLGIKSACREGASVMVSSHYTQEIVDNCTRFYLLAHQQLQAFDNADQLLARYQATSLDEAFMKALAV